MFRPSVQDRLAPKKRVVIMTIRIGMNRPTMPWMIATSAVTVCRNAVQLDPSAASAASTAVGSSPPVTPMMIGVPTAPKETGVL